jgi:hypothetical protein
MSKINPFKTYVFRPSLKEYQAQNGQKAVILGAMGTNDAGKEMFLICTDDYTTVEVSEDELELIEGGTGINNHYDHNRNE